MKECIAELHECLEILERKDPYELHEIHDVYGIKLSDGTFCFHGEQTDEKIKLIPATSTEDFTCLQFSKESKGREIKDTIIDYLSEYEYICSGVNNKIFDDKTVKSLLKGSIVSKYTLFKKYIEHQQISTGNKYYFSEFTLVAERYMNETE